MIANSPLIPDGSSAATPSARPTSRSIAWAALVAALALILQGRTLAQAPAVEVGVDAPAAAAPSSQPTTAPPTSPTDDDRESFLAWMIRASGFIGLLILLMSFYLVALVVWMLLNYRDVKAIPPGLVQEMEDLLDRKQYDRAFQRAAMDGSFLARSVAAGVRKLPAGMPAAQRALELANEDVTMEMEHRTTYLATVGTLGPMIGLVGTVYGMIRSFQAIATSGSTPQAAQLAAGISTALFVTLEGIALSVPAIALYAFFRNRIARMSLEVQREAEGLLERFAPGVRVPHPLIASQPPSRAALPPRAPEPEA